MRSSDPTYDGRFMPTDNENDLLPEEMMPLTKLSKNGTVYVVRAEYQLGYVSGLSGQRKIAHYYVERSRAVVKMEELFNTIARDKISYLALDVYYGELRSRLSSVVVIDRRGE